VKQFNINTIEYRTLRYVGTRVYWITWKIYIGNFVTYINIICFFLCSFILYQLVLLVKQPKSLVYLPINYDKNIVSCSNQAIEKQLCTKTCIPIWRGFRGEGMSLLRKLWHTGKFGNWLNTIRTWYYQGVNIFWIQAWITYSCIFVKFVSRYVYYLLNVYSNNCVIPSVSYNRHKAN
jgi:hypothetical protein